MQEKSPLRHAPDNRFSMLDPNDIEDYDPALSAEDEMLEAACVSPSAAVRSPFVWVNTFVSGGVNFGINGGCVYAFLKNYDYAGLWETPDNPPATNAYGASIALDLFLTSLIVVFLSTLMSAGGIHKELKKGTIMPVSDSQLRKSRWRFFPMRTRNLCTRAFLLALQFTVLWFGGTILLMATICAGGGMSNPGEVCHMRVYAFVWFKGCWAMCLAFVVWPIQFLGAINRATLPQDVYDVVVERQKTANMGASGASGATGSAGMGGLGLPSTTTIPTSVFPTIPAAAAPATTTAPLLASAIDSASYQQVPTTAA